MNHLVGPYYFYRNFQAKIDGSRLWAKYQEKTDDFGIFLNENRIQKGAGCYTSIPILC